MTNLEEIGKNVSLLRRARGLTQEDVAYRANISTSCLQAIEYRGRNMTVETVLRLSGSLGVDVRVIGIFTRTDQEILGELGKSRRLPRQGGEAMQICRNILLMRKEKGLSQAELARRSNISVGYLRDIEHGCANVTIGKLLGIAEGFGMSLVELRAVSMYEEELMELVYQARKAAKIF